MTAPVAYRWNGDAMQPMPRFAAQCNRDFVVGQVYVLEELQERSSKSHAHYFACIAAAWHSLPDDMAARFPSPEHLRKWALIRAGYVDSREMVARSRAEALRIAAFLRPADDYAVVETSGAAVRIWTARSQSVRAMGKREFQASKDAVLAVIADVIGATAKQVETAA